MRKLIANTYTSTGYHSKHFICVNSCHPWGKYYRWGMELAKCFGHMAQTVKRLSTMWETWVRSLGWEDSLEKEMATHSSALALKIPWTEELGVGYYPWGCKESGTTERLHFLYFLSLLVRGRARIRTLAVKCMPFFFFCGHAAHLSWTRIWTCALSSNESTSPNYLSEVKVTQSCPTLCDPMDCPVHVILQAGILDWVAVPFSSGSSQPRDQTQVSRIAGRFFTS